ncbi:MAG: rhodanese-like domain-containing protein, partial [Nitrospira sp.]
RIGVDNICGVLAGGFEGWRDAGHEIEMSGTLSVTSTQMEATSMSILDVRDITEYEESHIAGSKHAYVGFLSKLKHVDGQLDPEKALAVTCGVGHRASLAVSILLRMGFVNVFNLLGGITAWEKVGKPLVSGPDARQSLDLKGIGQGSTKESTSQSLPTPA